MMDVAWGSYRVPGSNLLTPGCCEVSTFREESPIGFDAAALLQKGSIARAEYVHLLQNSRCSFWYNLGSVYSIKAGPVPYDHNGNSLTLNLPFRLCHHIISRQSPHLTSVRFRTHYVLQHLCHHIISLSTW
jgi:hypothetical protein